MGADWTLFRIQYLFQQKNHHFDRVNQEIVNKTTQLNETLLTLPPIGWVNPLFRGDKNILERADNAIDGKIFAFSNEYFDYTNNHKIAWNMNPITKVEADNSLNWNQLPDFGEYGDIKLIWEASRFPQVYSFINAYALTQNEKYAKACIKQIVEWIESNPFPKGVNYKCGQEITFRIIAWMVALDYFRAFLDKEDEKKIVQNIYASALRIDANIDYAARAVKNNHSISESIGLILFGLYFKQFDEAEKFLKKGLEYLEKECNYQIYSDGSYIQSSFTYQRLALDILSFIIMVSNKKNIELPKKIKEQHKRMIDFLNSFIQENGWLPNYGTNDGANLFPISSSNYRDFRPNLNFAMAVNQKKKLYAQQNSLIELFNLEGKETTTLNPLKRFDDGGYYILKNDNIFAFTRCHSYRHRPAQNDMLHLDIWYKGNNVFCDAGSFSYNTDKEFKNNFNGTIGHNTILIDNQNQMEQVLNFGWANWTKSKLIEFHDKLFHGEHYAYQKRYGTTCNRRIELLNNSKIFILDTIQNTSKESINIKQLWNTKEHVELVDEFTVKVANCILSSNFPIKLEKSYISDYYNSYVEGTKIVIETNSSNKETTIKTTMEFRS
jgi:hypothetical protein